MLSPVFGRYELGHERAHSKQFVPKTRKYSSIGFIHPLSLGTGTRKATSHAPNIELIRPPMRFIRLVRPIDRPARPAPARMESRMDHPSDGAASGADRASFPPDPLAARRSRQLSGSCKCR